MKGSVRKMAAILKNLRTTFRQLRWRLTWSYTAVTVGALLVVLIILVLLVLPSILLPNNLLAPDSAPFWYHAANEQSVPLARYLLSESPINTEGLAMFANRSNTARFGRFDLFSVGDIHLYLGTTTNVEMLIINPEGALLGRTHYPAFPVEGELFDANSIPGLEPLLHAALAGESDPHRLVSIRESGKELIVTTPVFGFNEFSDQLLGVLVYIAESIPTQDDMAAHTIPLAGRAVIIFLIGAGILGALFGSLTAKRMADRLRNLAQATNAWSQGDFTGFIADPTGDEISQLAQDLNSMAEQLLNLLKRRQAMAISEERNRLARDLHDSAKQQALAASFQLGTAITLFDRDPETARKHLNEADTLVDVVRKELTDLILELRPPAMNGRDFVEIMNEYAIEWAHQNGIDVDVNVSGYHELTLEITQTLYRILQEALANIARHSSADSTDVKLIFSKDTVTLSITDNGCGFNTDEKFDGMGLHSMRERTESVNGNFIIESAPGQGTSVYVTISIN
jgi:NarL family two-component system sensor histidine kinase LiaS